MNFKSELEEAIGIYQQRVEGLMGVELGKVDVKRGSLEDLYVKMRSNEIYSKLGLNRPFSSIMTVTNQMIKGIFNSTYTSTLDDSMTIYITSGDLLNKILTDDTGYTELAHLSACKSLTQLAHKKIVGPNLTIFWSEEKRTALANHVAMRLVPMDNNTRLSHNEWERLMTSARSIQLPEGYTSKDYKLSEYVRQEAETLKQSLKVYPQLSGIDF